MKDSLVWGIFFSVLAISAPCMEAAQTYALILKFYLHGICIALVEENMQKFLVITQKTQWYLF